MTSDLYFMSPPSRGWKLRGRANFRSRDAGEVDATLARREWLALAERIEALGGVVCAVESPDDALSGLPYAAEAGHPLPPTRGGSPRFVLPRMAARHRRLERDVWGRVMRELQFDVLDLPEDVVWEGQGDVAWFRDVTLMFFGGRTTKAGHDAAREFFSGEILELQLREPAFHGNMALLPLATLDRMLVCPDVILGDGLAQLEARFGKERIWTVSEDEIRCYATNGLPVGDHWVVPTVAPKRVTDRVAEAGMQVVALPMAELCEKAGGASRCLACVFPGGSSYVAVPESYRLATVAERIRRDG